MIVKIATGLSQKPNFSGYTWVEDMRAEAILTVVKYLRNFNPEKSSNPFAYVTTICTNAFRGYIMKQRKNTVIKNQLFEHRDCFSVGGIDDCVGTAIDYSSYAEKQKRKKPKKS